MMLREAYTAVIAQGETWKGTATTEPYEAAWASEALFFLRALNVRGTPGDARAKVQISPDGMHWADEGTEIRLPSDKEEVTFCRVERFGQYLRLAVSLPEGVEYQVLATLSLKG
jgi:hypothetical protein